MDRDRLVELAERCEAKVVIRLSHFLDSNKSQAEWDNAYIDAIKMLESLLNIAAALRSHAQKEG